MHPIAILACLGAIVSWGSAAIFDKLAIAQFKSPWAAMALRTTFAWAFVMVGAAFTHTIRDAFTVPKGAFVAMALSGLVGGFLGMLFYYVAVRYEEVSKVVPVTATYPVIAFALGVIFLRESITWPKVIGLLMIVVGLALLTSAQSS